jgi:hypothetical protein
MVELICAIIGQFVGVLATVLIGIPTFFPKKPGQKISKLLISAWIGAVVVWAFLGGISATQVYELQKTINVLQNKMDQLQSSMIELKSNYDEKSEKLDFKNNFISLLPDDCIQVGKKKYAASQKNLEVVDQLHVKIGSPDMLSPGGLGVARHE